MDAIEFMKEIDDNSVDLIIIDPPYNIGKDEWDKINNYLEWFKLILLQLQRVLKKNGSFYFFHNDFLTITKIQNSIDYDVRMEFIFKQMIVWEKFVGNKQYYGRNFLMGFNNSNKRNYHQMCEYCLFYVLQEEDGKNNYNPIRDYLREQKKKSRLTNKKLNRLFSEYTNKEGCIDRSVIEHYFGDSQWIFPTKEIYENILQKTGFFDKPYNELKKEYLEFRYTFNPQKDTSTVWLFPPEKKKEHLTPKNLDFIKKIIRFSSNIGDLVLDCFMGSGTTAIACKQLGRNFIGCDNNEDYVKMANKRLAQENLNSITTPLTQTSKSKILTFPKEKGFNMRYQENSNEVSQMPNGTSDNANIISNLKKCPPPRYVGVGGSYGV